jgi:hypothetical protein
MSNKLLVASLTALAASCAFAIAVNAAPSDPVSPPGAKPTPAPPPACVPGGDEVFTIEHKSDTATNPQWKFTLLSKGMFSVTTVQKGKTVTASGCVGMPSVSRIRSLFAGVKWELVRLEATCAAWSADYIDYGVAGRNVFRERMCSNVVLDEASQKALTAALAIVKPFDAIPATPPSPPSP